MFNKEKISLNHIRASKSNNNKVNKFFTLLSTILADKLFTDNNFEKFSNMLELSARNDYLYKYIKSKGYNINLYQTILSRHVRIKNENKIVSDLDSIPFREEVFDICMNIFSINNSSNIPLFFRNVYSILKRNGIFLAVFPSEECLKEFRYFFLTFFKPNVDSSFSPVLDMQTIGNIGVSAGFKNVIVDKENFYLNITKPEDIWLFIRELGESNSIFDRKNFFVTKSKYIEFYTEYLEQLKKNNSNTFSFYFFVGKK